MRFDVVLGGRFGADLLRSVLLDGLSRGFSLRRLDGLPVIYEKDISSTSS